MKHGTTLSALFLGLGLLLGSTTPASVAAQDVEVNSAVELVLATGIQDREPVGVVERFPADVGRVYAWMRLTGHADQAIQVVWSHGENTFEVPLEIGGSPWRTWSSKTIPAEWSGAWSVSVEDAEGNVLASADFTVGTMTP